MKRRKSGLKIDNYKNNPVVLFGHSLYDLPIGKATSIEMKDGRTIAEGVFASHAKAQEVRGLYDMGIGAVSIGFIANERDQENDKVIKESELLEFSFVPVPANPYAGLLKQMGMSDRTLNDISKGAKVEVDEVKREINVKGDDDDEPAGVMKAEYKAKLANIATGEMQNNDEEDDANIADYITILNEIKRLNEVVSDLSKKIGDRGLITPIQAQPLPGAPGASDKDITLSKNKEHAKLKQAATLLGSILGDVNKKVKN